MVWLIVEALHLQEGADLADGEWIVLVVVPLLLQRLKVQVVDQVLV
jgi:hypothetical protein